MSCKTSLFLSVRNKWVCAIDFKDVNYFKNNLFVEFLTKRFDFISVNTSL